MSDENPGTSMRVKVLIGMIVTFVIYHMFFNPESDDRAVVSLFGCLLLPLIVLQMIFVLIAPKNRQVLMQQVIQTNEAQAQTIVVAHSIAKPDSLLEKIVKWFARLGMVYVLILCTIFSYLLYEIVLSPILDEFFSENPTEDELFCGIILITPVLLALLVTVGGMAISGTSVYLSFSKKDEEVKLEMTTESKMALASAAMNQTSKKVMGSIRKSFSEMTVVQLKEELKKKGLPVSGKKAELIARLRANKDSDVSLEGD